MSDVNLAIIKGREIVQAQTLNQTSGPATVKAVPHARYVLAAGEGLLAPEVVTLQRSGNNLLVTLEGHDQPQLVIDDYYAAPGEIIGLAEDGQWHAYIAANAHTEQNPQGLQDGDSSAVLLASDTVNAPQDLTLDNAALSVGLISFAALGAAAALVFLANSHHDRDKSAPPPEEKPAEDQATDTPHEEQPAHTEHEDASADGADHSAEEHTPASDHGEAEAGVLSTPEVSTNNQPMLNGSDEAAGSVVEVRNHGESLGSTQVNAQGDWQFTPPEALANGLHSFDVVVTSPDGSVSAPSEALQVMIQSETPAEPPLSLEQLMPADSDISIWAMHTLGDGDVPPAITDHSCAHSTLTDDLHHAGFPSADH